MLYRLLGTVPILMVFSGRHPRYN